MKLLQRTALYQALLALPMVALGTGLGYLLVHRAVTAEVDETLEYHAGQVQQQADANEPPKNHAAPGLLLQVRPGTLPHKEFRDTTIYDTLEQERIPWRIGRFPLRQPDGSSAVLTLGRSQLETDELVTGIAGGIAAMLVVFSLCTLLLYHWLSGRIWLPFRANLRAMETFRPDAKAPVLTPSRVEEFAAMAGALDRMMGNMQRAFTAQKRFTEQAAHELRTPLAILRGRLDQLIQSPQLGEADAAAIQGIDLAIGRMGRIVADMLALAEIGDGGFPPGSVDWPALFAAELRLVKGLCEHQGIQAELRNEGPCALRLHSRLAQLLVANLVRNAVQHNVQNGSLVVTLAPAGITVCNTGPRLTVEPATLFQRFAKGNPASSSPGLGLAMVKEIADRNGLRVSYTEDGGMHRITVAQLELLQDPDRIAPQFWASSIPQTP